jgi:hypothetical protein
MHRHYRPMFVLTPDNPARQCAQPAVTDASDRLIDIVDRVMKRHPGKATPHQNLFSFLKRDRPLVRPSVDRPSPKIEKSPVPYTDTDAA